MSKFVKVKLHLSGDVRSVPVEEADILVKTKRASLVRNEPRETATKRDDAEKAVK
ncbi:hypothetical protein [Phyllobacterium phragmitis]|uniref:hypothetical protein n=1 Tax=Phyllobacterium phragmitis TaxID=2670329 RepID=UPI0013047E62|nr:hypothetical protein [Phyllobacterium phragmitis]